MEGLAAASGVIAVASVTLQLGDTIRALLDFWKAVRDAPEDVQMLFEEISVLSFILRDIKEHTSDHIELHPIFDDVLERCNKQLSKLRGKLPKSASNFKSRSFTIRTWKSLKIALKKNEIKEITTVIERAKNTLILLQQRKFDRVQKQSLEVLLCRQQQAGCNLPKNAVEESGVRIDLTEINRDRAFLPVRQMDINGRKGDEIRDRYLYRGINQTICEVQPTRRLWIRTYQHLRMQRYVIRTPLYLISIFVRSRKMTTAFPSEVTDAVVTDRYYVLYPTKLLSTTWSSRGVVVLLNYSTSWQWNSVPFRAVPERALIFELCRAGDLVGVRRLLDRGDAFVQDMDSSGRTPLWVAANSLQVEVAELLLERGANPKVPTFSSQDDTPFMAIDISNELEAEKKLSMLALFQKHCPDSFDDENVLHVLAKLLLFYRPTKIIPMRQVARRNATLKIVMQLTQEFPENDSFSRSILVDHMIQFLHHQSSLHWLLQSIKGPLHRDGLSVEGGRAPVLIEAIKKKLPFRDPQSMKLITQKTLDLHKLHDGKVIYTGPKTSVFTATSFSLRQPCMFLPWRDILVELGISIEDFVREELALEKSPLASEGWSFETLTSLFKMKSYPNTCNGTLISGFLMCDRCGRKEPGPPVVDLPWRRHLRNLRNGRTHESCCGENPSTELKPPPLEVVDANFQHENGVEDPAMVAQGDLYKLKATSLPGRINAEGVLEPWPYEQVCPGLCTDGICVSGAYENDFTDEPILPPFSQQRQTNQSSPVPKVEVVSSKDANISEKYDDEENPTRNMPGAYR